MKLIRKCGVLIMHKSIKCRRSGNHHDYWVAYHQGTFRLNWCNGYRMTTHSTYKSLKEALEYFDSRIAP